jgi:hypothetical protein
MLRYRSFVNLDNWLYYRWKRHLHTWIDKDTFNVCGHFIMSGTLLFDPALLFVLVKISMFVFVELAEDIGSLGDETCSTID